MNFFDNSDFFRSDVLAPVGAAETQGGEASVPKSSRSSKKNSGHRSGGLVAPVGPSSFSGGRSGFASASVFGLALLVAPLSAITSTAQRIELSVRVQDAVTSDIDNAGKETSDWARGVMERTAREGPAKAVDPKVFMAAIRKLRASIKTA